MLFFGEVPNDVFLFKKSDVRQIKLLLILGCKQHDIAAYYGINQGRISEINRGRCFKEIEPANELDASIEDFFNQKQRLPQNALKNRILRLGRCARQLSRKRYC